MHRASFLSSNLSTSLSLLRTSVFSWSWSNQKCLCLPTAVERRYINTRIQYNNITVIQKTKNHFHILVFRFTQLPPEFLHRVYCNYLLTQLVPWIHQLSTEKSLSGSWSVFLYSPREKHPKHQPLYIKYIFLSTFYIELCLIVRFSILTSGDLCTVIASFPVTIM